MKSKKLNRKDYPNTIIGLLYLLLDYITLNHGDGLCFHIINLSELKIINVVEKEYLFSIIKKYRERYAELQIPNAYYFYSPDPKPRINYINNIIKDEKKHDVDLLYILYRNLPKSISKGHKGLCQIDLNWVLCTDSRDHIFTENDSYELDDIIYINVPFQSKFYAPFYFKPGTLKPRQRYLKRLIKKYNPKQFNYEYSKTD